MTREDDRNRLPALDGVRGLAILLVMVFHIVLVFPFEASDQSIYYRICGIGWIGVDLFFVLSGFLISGILLDTKDDPGYFKLFFIRRALRIFPLYYAVLIFLFVALPPFGVYDSPQLEFVQGHQVWFWTYLTNWGFVAAKGARFFNAEWLTTVHFWSLAVEEQFYLIWPFLVFLSTRKGLVRICLMLIIGAFALRLSISILGLPQGAAYTLTPCRIDSLAVGSLVALAVRHPGAKMRLYAAAPWCAVAGAVAMLAVFVLRDGIWFADQWMNTAGFSILAVGWAGLLVMCLPDHRARVLRGVFEVPVMRMLGKYSYGLYLLHHLVLPHLPAEPYLALPVPEAVAATFFIAVNLIVFLVTAWLSWNLLEKPILGLKRFASYDHNRPSNAAPTGSVVTEARGT